MMEFYIGDSIMCGDAFDVKREEVENLYLTDLDASGYNHYGQSNLNPFNNHHQQQEGDMIPQNILNWTGQDCMDWANRLCFKHGIDTTFINLNAFGSVTGEILSQYSQYDFCSLVTFNYGSIFYQEFRDMLERTGLYPNSPMHPEADDIYNFESDSHMSDDYQLTDLDHVLPTDLENIEPCSLFLNDPQPFNNSFNYQDDMFCEQTLHSEYESYSIINEQDQSSLNVPKEEDDLSDLVPSSPESVCSQSPKDPILAGSNVLEMIKTTSRKRVRGPKNWEYLMRLLSDKEYNPRVIRWEDKDDHTFRIVKTDVVAQQWGQRSKKQNLTYDNFARGLRYHYTTGALEAVSERQLVYRCGPKALKYLAELANC